jgi:phosphoribosylformylglycinamidine cyclo-ligase
MEAYGNLNMGAGFALFVPESKVNDILLQYNDNFCSYVAGYVEKSPVKRVVNRPKDLEYKSETLAVR